MEIAVNQPGSAHANHFVPVDWSCMNDRHKNHAENYAKKQSVEIRDKTAHVSSCAVKLVREC